MILLAKISTTVFTTLILIALFYITIKPSELTDKTEKVYAILELSMVALLMIGLILTAILGLSIMWKL